MSFRFWMVAGSAALALAACAPKSRRGAASPTLAATAEPSLDSEASGDDLDDDLADIENRLADNERALLHAGITMPSAGAAPHAEERPAQAPKHEPEPVTDADDEASGGDTNKRAAKRCDRICALSETSCELAQNVCRLASRHHGDPHYGDTCARAERQCTAATNACRDC